MNKDGRAYLCKVENRYGVERYVVLQWGRPAALSVRQNHQRWIDSSGLSPKFKRILWFKECDKII